MINREHKDRLFKAIFGSAERKCFTLELYNALNGSSYKDPNELEFYTIEDAIYMGMKNDLSFIIGLTLNLYEQQSSFNPNMPLRGLSYFARQYEKYIEQRHINIYSERLQKLPTPRFIVFYNGSRPLPEKSYLKLSDAFMLPSEHPSVEITAELLNINYSSNAALLKACRPLEDYSKFVSYVKINTEKGMPIEQAVDEAVERAADESLLSGFFSEHKAEVRGMLLTEYDENFVHKGWYEDGFAEGHAEGRAEGLSLGQVNERFATVERMLAAGFNDEQIRLATDASDDEIIAARKHLSDDVD